MRDGQDKPESETTDDGYAVDKIKGSGSILWIAMATGKFRRECNASSRQAAGLGPEEGPR